MGKDGGGGDCFFQMVFLFKFSGMFREAAVRGFGRKFKKHM